MNKCIKASPDAAYCGARTYGYTLHDVEEYADRCFYVARKVSAFPWRTARARLYMAFCHDCLPKTWVYSYIREKDSDRVNVSDAGEENDQYRLW